MKVYCFFIVFQVFMYTSRLFETISEILCKVIKKLWNWRDQKGKNAKLNKISFQSACVVRATSGEFTKTVFAFSLIDFKLLDDFRLGKTIFPNLILCNFTRQKIFYRDLGSDN